MRKKTKEKGRKNKKNIILKILLFLLVTIVIASVSGSLYAYNYLNKISKKSYTKEEVIPKKTEEDGIVNILIMGTDAGTAGSENDTDPKRTDTIMLLHYNPKTEAATLVSIPRDTLVQLKGKDDKINAAHFYGGVNLLVDTVQNLLGLTVNYYAKIDLNGFVKLIDILGGVQVTIERNMNYDDPTQNLHIHFTKGQTILLNGKQAEEFFRWRKNNNGTGLANGDLDRINLQHAFIQKVIGQLQSPTVIPKIPAILSSIPQYVDTNMTADEILKYGYIFAKISSSTLNITTLSGEGKYISGISYFVWKQSADTTLLNTLRETNNINQTANQSKDNRNNN